MVDRRSIGWAALLYLGATMAGLGVAYAGGLFTSKATTSPSSPYAITFVETMNVWNSTSQPQPSFYLLSSKGPVSLTTVSLPAHRLIQLTIVSYDNVTPGSTDYMGKVTGTVGGNVYLMNGTIATMGIGTWGKNVTSVPGSALAHTFTMPQLGINIPVVGGSTVIAYLYFDKAGTYIWVCLTPCGFSQSPSNTGAMSTAGWMEGQIVVQ